MKRILVVEDEPKIARLARDYLQRAGFEVLTAGDGKGALVLARSRKPDLIVLDLGLPGLDGLDVIRALRRGSAVPIVVVSARGEESDRVVGLELGADDYLVKPFSPNELVARVRAVLRRTESAEGSTGQPVRAGDVEVDPARMCVTVGGRVVTVTPAEFALLATLVRSPGRVFTRSQLLDAIHGDTAEAYERAIDGHVKNLRRKLESDAAMPRYLVTVHGVGYKFGVE
jgi:two-component system alkaline phosphatase synthesis response regulator PhoP